MVLDFNFKEDFDDKELRRILRNMEKIESVEVRFGWWDRANYPRRHKAKGLPVAQIAFWNEFGTRSKNGKTHIPARPYLSRTGLMVANIALTDIKQYFLENIYGPRYSKLALNDLPEKIHKLFASVVGTGVQLSAKTVKRKGHSEHWKETGRLLKTFQVKIMKASQEDSQ